MFKKVALIYFLALGIELILLVLVVRHAGWSFNPYLTGFDTIEYSTIAKNLLINHSFSKSLTTPFIPNFFRSPGYPFWLAFIYFIFGSFKPAVFLGMLIFSFSAPLTYLIAREVFSGKLAFWTGIVLAIEPRMAFTAPFLLSEQIFLPVFLFSIFFAAKFFNNPKKKYIFFSVIFLGASSLIRGISLYLLPALLIFFFVRLYKKHPLIKILKILVLATMVLVLVISPWLIRNKLTLGTFQPNSLFGIQLYWGHLEALEIYLGIPQELAHQKLVNLANDLVGNNFETPLAISILTKEAVKEIKSNLFSSIKIYLFNSALFFITDGYKGIASYIINIKPNYINLSDLIIKFKFKEIFYNLKNFSLLELTIPILGRVFWTFLTILSLFGFYAGIRNMIKQRLILMLFFSLILYFAIISGSVVAVDPRFRMPINGFLFAFAMVSIFHFFKINFKHESVKIV